MSSGCICHILLLGCHSNSWLADYCCWVKYCGTGKNVGNPEQNQHKRNSGFPRFFSMLTCLKIKIKKTTWFSYDRRSTKLVKITWIVFAVFAAVYVALWVICFLLGATSYMQHVVVCLDMVVFPLLFFGWFGWFVQLVGDRYYTKLSYLGCFFSFIGQLGMVIVIGWDFAR